ncbi:hypothetical protein FACS189440_06440 [Bacteroidia bacterium]|nr:hypothetical protein FACS189440_06440 [Bacteroidia bacterium]
MNSEKTKLSIWFFICIFIVSCNKNKDNHELSDEYSLVKNTEKTHVFKIGNDVHYLTISLFPFKDAGGNKYLTFQNGVSNEILFYNMENPNLLFKVTPTIEGPNGVGMFLGYHIEDIDKIYLTVPGRPVLFQINKNGDILQKIEYEKTDNDKPIIPFFLSTSDVYSPLIIINNNFYFTQMRNHSLTLTASPVSGYIDTLTHSVNVLPFYFPPIMNDQDIAKYTMGNELCFSRIFDGNKFIYSFFLDEYIYSTSINHEIVDKKRVNSRYMNKLYKPQTRPEEIQSGLKKLCEIAIYGNLIYDQYRQVYYRVAYPETEMEEDADYLEIYRTGRKKFSIIILDKNMNIIGETLFPEYTYISNAVFVDEDGLHIRTNHQKNPDFQENLFIFDCFELSKK